ncbi:S1C family serine protease [Nocardioides pakistanensis]
MVTGPGWSQAPRQLGQAVAAGVAVVAMCAGCTATDDAPAEESSESSTSEATASVSATAPTEPPQQVDWTGVADQAETSVVSISVAGPQGAGEGSGVIVDRAGHVITNHHVVAPAVTGGQVQVTLSDARVFGAAVVGTDPATDLAVLRIDQPPEELNALPFGDSEEVTVGQPVMALGNPLGLSHTVTLGIVSALDRPVTTENVGTSPTEPATPVVTNAIQTDAAINPGNSGGALVNAAGQLIGINSSIITLGSSPGGQGGSIGLGFAIPVNQVRWVADELIRTGRVRHAYLGVSLQNAVIAVDGVRREAAGITDVAAGTPAAQAGLSPGDAVIGVEDETVAGAESLVAQIREREPGTDVTLTVVGSNGQPTEVTVEFGTRPGE